MRLREIGKPVFRKRYSLRPAVGFVPTVVDLVKAVDYPKPWCVVGSHLFEFTRLYCTAFVPIARELHAA